MKVIVHFDRNDAGRLHCDECGYDMPEKVAFTTALIGYECPKCSANMLTAEDYAKTDRMFRFFDWANKWFGPIFGKEPTPANLAGQETISVKIHGNETVVRRHVNK